MPDDLDAMGEIEFEALLVGDVPMGLVSADLAKHQVVRPKEVMELLGVSRATLYRMIKSGMLPRPRVYSVRVTGWAESVLTDWLAAREETRRVG